MTWTLHEERIHLVGTNYIAYIDDYMQDSRTMRRNFVINVLAVTAHILWPWINPKKLGLRRRKGDAKRKGKKTEYRKVKLSQIWSNFDHIWKVWMLNSLKSIKQQIWTDDTHNLKGGIRIFVKQRLKLRSYMRRQNGYLGIFINLSCEMLLSQSTLGQHGNTVQSMY